MSIPELIQTATGWLAWSGLALSGITLIAFLVRWEQRFRLIGVTSFNLLLLASCWAFGVSYTPPLAIEGALTVPVVYDNSTDLVVAQASADFPDAAIKPTLEQLAGNLHAGGYNSPAVHVRLRKLEPAGDGVSQPVILGEVIRDLHQNITLPVAEKSHAE
ncbi:MAG: Ycf51 family protein [Prochlorococcus sp.]|jgi:hypothetical protein|nr:Ycf51 family protein [Prochlorococcaceae cyanobacterium ETNP18_MAG_14]MDP6321904.1 Ycf51 family protein [Prochlorococcaceae cyanobacterium ETNP14_MAG_5]HJM80094.1 Ycf51 family protein [Prochlorococcaceae cyanobacterium Fu_MAG_72]|tara:strand:- start:3229 stop:3708 length:480 start_codon:yes stop_codon:yes gene_type:complete